MKSYFEEIDSFILPSDPVANNNDADPNKDTCLTLDAKSDASNFGGRDGSAGVCLRFHKRQECLKLVIQERKLCADRDQETQRTLTTLNAKRSALTSLMPILTKARRQVRRRKATVLLIPKLLMSSQSSKRFK